MKKSKLNKEELDKFTDDLVEKTDIALTSAIHEISYEEIEVMTNLWMSDELHDYNSLEEINEKVFTLLAHLIHSVLKDYRDVMEVDPNEMLDHLKKQVIKLQEFEKPGR